MSITCSELLISRLREKQDCIRRVVGETQRSGEVQQVPFCVLTQDQMIWNLTTEFRKQFLTRLANLENGDPEAISQCTIFRASEGRTSLLAQNGVQ
jgi:hypothetical protein